MKGKAMKKEVKKAPMPKDMAKVMKGKKKC